MKNMFLHNNSLYLKECAKRIFRQATQLPLNRNQQTI